MVQRVGGSRHKTRSKFRKNRADRGKIFIGRYLQQFQKGERVILKLDPSVHIGMYFRRFHSKTGVVEGRQGQCYRLIVKDGNKDKIIITHPAHLVKDHA